MTSLQQRLLAAAVLIPLVVAAVLLLPSMGFALALAAFALAGAHEWTRIGSLGGSLRGVFMATVAVSLTAGLVLLHQPWLMAVVIGLAMAGWLLALAAVLTFQRGNGLALLDRAAARFVAGWLVLVPTWMSLVWLHTQRPGLVLFVLVLIWTADSAAYFAGRRFGNRRLASRVSPGKSWEGVAGALLAVATLSVLAALGDGASIVQVMGFLVLSLVVAAASVLGDLAESLFKRRAGVKDSGTLIPGHGGVLDRIDSLTAAAPVFTAGWMALGGFA